MLARLQRRLLAAELTLYGLTATLLTLALERGPGAAAAIVALLVLSARAAYVGTAFALAGGGDPDRPRPGPWGFLRVFLGEVAAFTLTHSVLQPATPLTRRLQPPRAPGGAPLLFVHGYCCNAQFWVPLRRHLHRAGYRDQLAVDLEPVFAGIDELADALHGHIEGSAAARRGERLVLVTHSMGGLVARAYLQRHGSRRVRALATLGTPHGGTRLARLGPGPNARQMRPGVRWLAALAPPPAALPVLALASPLDELVSPAASALLPGRDGGWLPPCGHLALGQRRDTAERLARWLRALADAPTNGGDAVHVSAACSGQVRMH